MGHRVPLPASPLSFLPSPRPAFRLFPSVLFPSASLLPPPLLPPLLLGSACSLSPLSAFMRAHVRGCTCLFHLVAHLLASIGDLRLFVSLGVHSFTWGGVAASTSHNIEKAVSRDIKNKKKTCCLLFIACARDSLLVLVIHCLRLSEFAKCACIHQSIVYLCFFKTTKSW